jgi:signal transduction histidine kinase
MGDTSIDASSVAPSSDRSRSATFARARASVRLRVTAAVVLLVALVFGVGAALLLRSVERSVRDQVEEGNREALGQFTVALQGEGIGQPLAVATSGDRLLQVFGSNDELIAASVPSGAAGETMVVPVGAGGVGGQAFTSVLPPDYLVTEGYAASPTGLVRIRAAAPTSSADISFGAMRTALWWVVPVLVTMIGALTWLLVGRSLRPVAALTRRVAEISASTLHERVPEPASRDEVGRLARTMNGMLDRLDASARRQREFVADASHELRSPLASIRTQVEVASMPAAEVGLGELTSGVLAETDRLDAIVGDLLTLARLEEAEGARDVPLLHLGEIVTDEAARARRVPVLVHLADPDIVVAAEPDGIRRSVRHLLDNAARHADERVTVEVGRDGAGTVFLIVDDDGCGVPVADRARILERFVRLDEARTRDAGGAGLGLAVVRDVVAGLGGEVIVGDAPAGGARFEMLIPMAGSSSAVHMAGSSSASLPSER